jgi:hypothetical protein
MLVLVDPDELGRAEFEAGGDGHLQLIDYHAAVRAGQLKRRRTVRPAARLCGLREGLTMARWMRGELAEARRVAGSKMKEKSGLQTAT